MSRIASTFRRLKEEGGWYRPLTPLAMAIALGAAAVAYYHVGVPPADDAAACAFPDCFPDATNSGVPSGTTLTTYTGSSTIDTDGTTIDSKDIQTCLTITADNVTITNSTISCDPGGGIAVNVQTGSLTITDSEIDCANTTGTGLGSESITATRVDISLCENGLDVNSNFTLTDSYVHALVVGSGSHTDGAQFNQGGDSVTFEHNTIVNVSGGNSTIIMWDGADPQGSNILIQHNRLLGEGQNYTIYTPRDPPLTNVKVINNRLGIGGNGYNGGDGSILTDSSGNIDDVTGDPVDIS